MRRLLFLSGLLVCSLIAATQTVPYNVVFDLTSRDTNDHKTVLRWINGISAERPDAKLEVVLYGGSLDMVRKGKSVVANDIMKLNNNKNVLFKVCEGTLKRLNVDKSELLPSVGTVPDGIYEIITKQKEGWGYIKAAH